MADQKVEIMEPEEEGHEVQTGALMQINSAEINQQIMTAKAYPRDITTFRKDVVAAATFDEAVARSCMYALKRKNPDGTDKIIEGPSARMAEIVAQCWGNCRVGARTVEVGDTHVTAQGFFYDLQNNIAITFEVMRPIVGKKSDAHPNGKRFSNDMISVTSNAAGSIALRNAIFKAVPKAFWNHGYLAARAVVGGDLATIGERRTKAIKAFEKYEIVPEQVYALLGIKGAPDMSLDHIIFLGGLFNAFEEGAQKPDEAFHPDNFSTNGAMAVRPERSMFTRQSGRQAQTAKSDDVKPDVQADKAEAPAETYDTAQRSVSSDHVSVQEHGDNADTRITDDTKEDLRARELEDWLTDMRKEAETFKTVPTLQTFIDGVSPNLDGEHLEAWLAYTDALRLRIMNAFRASKPGKTK